MASSPAAYPLPLSPLTYTFTHSHVSVTTSLAPPLLCLASSFSAVLLWSPYLVITNL